MVYLTWADLCQNTKLRFQPCRRHSRTGEGQGGTVHSSRACHDKNPQQARGWFRQNIKQKTGPQGSSSPTPNAGCSHKAPHAKHYHWDGACRALSGSSIRKQARRSCVKISSAEYLHPKSIVPLRPPSSILRENLKEPDVDKPHARDRPAATHSASCPSKLLQAQVICLLIECPQDLPFHPGEAQETQVLTNAGCTRGQLLVTTDFGAYCTGLAQLTLGIRGTQGSQPYWDSQDCCWAPISGKPSQGLFQAPAQSFPASNTLAHHSSSACKDLWDCCYFSGLSSNKLSLGAALHTHREGAMEESWLP